MVSMKLASAAVAALSLVAGAVATSVDPIVIKGSKFFYKTNGTQFYIRGVAYQQDIGAAGSSTDDSNTVFVDPLISSSNCKRDIPYLTQLRTNTIRVYAIDTTQSHDDCMNMLADAGIYVIADLSAPNISINRDSPSWNAELYERYTSVVDTMQGYSNVLGFFAGNEVVNQANNSAAMPYVKAAVRDTKAYIASKGYRTIGVGYAADDDATIRDEVRTYMNCGPALDSIDFFGYNIYSWCGDSSFSTSGYSDRTKEFSTYNVPAFFAEYGCNTSPPRLFTETAELYSSDMTGVWSGGIVYEYFEATNDFGLVSVSSDSVSTLSDFSRLSTEIAKATPTILSSGSYSPTNSAQSCPSVTDTSVWAASTNLPPKPDDTLCSCMVNSLSCVAKSSVSTDDYSDLFNTACTSANCDGITSNGTTGSYGPYSMCSAADQLSYAINQYYIKHSSSSDSCDFNGSAQKQSASSASTCSSALSSASAAATAGSSSTSSSGSSSSSSSAAGALAIPHFDFALLQLGAFVTVAMMTGAGMILL